MKRTPKQNKALHEYFTNLSNALNEAGFDMKATLKPSIEIPWSKDMVKQFLWHPLQKIITDVDSTADLETADVDVIYKILDRHMATKFGVSVPFPSEESRMNEQQTRDGN